MSENCIKAYCPPCDVTFGVAPLPMDMMKLSKLMLNAKCPKCDGTDLQLDASDNPPDIPLPASPDQAG